jgi:hypothetical protein
MVLQTKRVAYKVLNEEPWSQPGRKYPSGNGRRVRITASIAILSRRVNYGSLGSSKVPSNK